MIKLLLFTSIIFVTIKTWTAPAPESSFNQFNRIYTDLTGTTNEKMLSKAYTYQNLSLCHANELANDHGNELYDEMRIYKDNIRGKKLITRKYIPRSKKDQFLLTGTKKEHYVLKYVLKTIRNFPDKYFDYFKECRKVFCVLSKIYGNDVYAAMSINFNYQTDFYFTHKRDSTEKNRTWTGPQIRFVYSTLKMIPKYILDKITLLKEFKITSKHIGNTPNVVGQASFLKKKITFYSPRYNIHTILHEIGHMVDITKFKSIFGIIPIDYEKAHSISDEYLSLRNWHSKMRTNRCDLIKTNYGLTSPQEDFANSFSNYIQMPKVFKANCPYDYDYFKNNVFDGKEYRPKTDLTLINAIEAGFKYCKNTPDYNNPFGSSYITDPNRKPGELSTIRVLFNLISQVDIKSDCTTAFKILHSTKNKNKNCYERGIYDHFFIEEFQMLAQNYIRNIAFLAFNQSYVDIYRCEVLGCNKDRALRNILIDAIDGDQILRRLTQRTKEEILQSLMR